MHISEILNQQRTILSYEFFPPKTQKGSHNLFRAIYNLIPLEPSCVSVTYGAGGSTRELTQELVVRIQKETSLTVVSHITCVGATKEEIKKILRTYTESGIENVMALRGDPPQDQEKFTPVTGGFTYATELVRFVKKEFPGLGIGVAGYPEGHPETPNRLKEMEHLKKKVDEGADYICTQLFFDNHDFYDFRERCVQAGITIPILAGIMPVTSMKNMQRIAELARGAHFPARFMKSLSRANSDEQIEKAGIHWSAEQVRDLLDNDVKGIHFYTLNKADHVINICSSLGIDGSDQLNK